MFPPFIKSKEMQECWFEVGFDIANIIFRFVDHVPSIIKLKTVCKPWKRAIELFFDHSWNKNAALCWNYNKGFEREYRRLLTDGRVLEKRRDVEVYVSGYFAVGIVRHSFLELDAQDKLTFSPRAYLLGVLIFVFMYILTTMYSELMGIPLQQLYIILFGNGCFHSIGVYPQEKLHQLNSHMTNTSVFANRLANIYSTSQSEERFPNIKTYLTSDECKKDFNTLFLRHAMVYICRLPLPQSSCEIYFGFSTLNTLKN